VIVRSARALAVLLAAAQCSTGCGDSSRSTRPGAPRFGIDWVAIVPAPTITARPCPAVDCLGMGDPALLRDASGALAAWYTVAGSDGGPFLMRSAIGADWSVTREPGSPLLPIAAAGVWDRFVETPSVWRDSTTGHVLMAYLGYADTGFVAPAIGVMLSADSAGRAWSRPAAPVYRPDAAAWDGVFLTGPSLLCGPDGLWRIYYSGAGTTVGIGLLTSVDGVSWSPGAPGPVLERRLGEWDEALLEPCVRYAAGLWWMWYSGYREPLGPTTRIGIGLATSSDGLTWTRQGDGPVLDHGTSGTWNELRVLSPDVLVESDGSLLMAAYGQRPSDPGVNAGSIAFWRSRAR